MQRADDVLHGGPGLRRRFTRFEPADVDEDRVLDALDAGVTCDGETVEAVTGDAVRVPAGSIGRYWAPEYARMVAVYAPNPQGLESRVHAYTRLEPLPADSAGVAVGLLLRAVRAVP